ncbi:MAG: aspartate/glutamate racemase family protein [Acetobacteraceae bacterium]|nr:aspartate/glutamate racemase family protein [Acetobacteraceae bacterium]
MRVAFVHTVSFLVDRFRSMMQAQHPGADCFHILNESLLQDLLRGEDTTEVYRRVVAQVLLAVDAGAGLVVMTCSSTSPAVDIARQVTKVPILKIDDPMAEEAVRLGSRIAVICTNTSTPGPSQALLRDHAAAQGRKVEIEAVIRPEAYQALAAGDRARHDALVTSAADDAATRSDVLVLAQASIAHLQPQLQRSLGKPVLASPELLMRELGRRLAA